MCFARDSRWHGEKPNRRDGSTSFGDPSMSTRDVSRVPADHQARSQEAVTTPAIKRNLGGTAAQRPRKCKSLSRERSRES